jgi:hypothetical protein
MLSMVQVGHAAEQLLAHSLVMQQLVFGGSSGGSDHIGQCFTMP